MENTLHTSFYIKITSVYLNRGNLIPAPHLMFNAEYRLESELVVSIFIVDKVAGCFDFDSTSVRLRVRVIGQLIHTFTGRHIYKAGTSQCIYLNLREDILTTQNVD